MTAREALRTIRLLAGQGRVRFTFHAEEETARLGAELAHVVFALAHASRCSWQVRAREWTSGSIMPSPHGACPRGRSD